MTATGWPRWRRARDRADPDTHFALGPHSLGACGAAVHGTACGDTHLRCARCLDIAERTQARANDKQGRPS